jgi:aminoglycoside 2''-phosphotransferase
MNIADCLTHIYDWNPSLAGQPFRADPYGLNNFVIIISDWVCRFPRSDESRARLGEEARLLAVVRNYVNTPIPDFIADEARPFVAYRLLPGRPLYRHDLLRLPDAAQDRFAADLATFLRDLHAIPADALALAALPPAPPPPGSPAFWRDHLAAIRAELFPHLWGDQQAAIEDLFAPVLDGRLDMTYPPALIHNDLASYHLLVGDNGQLTGVLDFGEAGWGDAAADYAALISGFGESFVARLIAVDPTIAAHLERARFRAAYIELEWALKGVRTGDPSWFLVHLGRARDSRPFGASG